MRRLPPACELSPKETGSEARNGKFGRLCRNWNCVAMIAIDQVERDRRHDAVQAHVERLERLVNEVREVLRRPGSEKEKLAFLREVLAGQGYRV